MEKIFRNSIHTKEKSHDCMVIKKDKTKIKLTYEAYNAVEKCNAEIFDGFKWNHVFSMLDTGTLPENSAYIWDETKRKNRASILFSKLEDLFVGVL